MGRPNKLTADEWDTCTYPGSMLPHLLKGSPRKLRLFAVACCHRLDLHVIDDRSKAAVQIAERFADGEVSPEELQRVYWLANDVWNDAAHDESDRWDDTTTDVSDVVCSCTYDDAENAAHSTVHLVSGIHERYSSLPNESLAQADLLRCIFGNPFRPVTFSPTWRSESAVSLARTAYDTRNFTLLPILADALEEARCDHAAILAHCRAANAVHARGCWVVDLVLNKS